ncbi:MAG: hypothetical protein ACK4NZ_02055 [Tsuneonella sp.]
MFVELAPLLVARQDGKPTPHGWSAILTPYRDLIMLYCRSLARDLEVRVGSGPRQLRLPLGCRFGKLQFSPVLQLAKLLDAPEARRVQFAALPATRNEIFRHFLTILGRSGYDIAEPTSFKAVLGFKLSSYVDFLVKLRRDDPVTFVMLLAHEFKFAREWAGHKLTVDQWIDRGAALAELGRLVEIVSYCKHQRAKVGDLRYALKLLRRSPAAARHANNPRVKAALPLIEQFAYGVEALRALSIGDRAGPPLAPTPSWPSTTPAMRIAAVARCAWLAKNKPVVVPGFETISKRFVRGRKGSAYSYYGIGLDLLLVVGIKDLANSLGRRGGIHSIRELAAGIHEGLFDDGVTFNRSSYQAALYAEVYLHQAGHSDSVSRFDPKCWFVTPDSHPVYERLWGLFIDGSDVRSDVSIGHQIPAAVSVLEQLVAPRWRAVVTVDPTLTSGALSQLACGLTPVAMDPLFAALVERTLIEREIPINFRKTPAVAVNLLLQPVFRASYCRFDGVDSRVNHDPRAKLPTRFP